MGLIALVSLASLLAGYLLYGRFLSRWLGLDDRRATPAVTQADGADFVPAKRFYLLGQHFSAIAAAGPIAGPILACLAFGWLPCLLWIVFGGILIGAVHDFTSLVASVRHRGSSIAEVTGQSAGRRARVAMLIFVWVALIYVIVAFTDITARTYVGLTGELAGAPFNPGGAVALASVLYVVLALVMSAVQRALAPPLWLLTLVFVPATLALVWLGTKASTLVVLDGRTWILILLAYCFVAALLPVQVLLQPRGYLGGLVLYLALAAGTAGIFLADIEIAQPAFKGFVVPGATGALFPFLFVTIACGACSGFHSLVCSGTTSKQIARESDCRPVGYGAMLLESFVAVIALATVMMVADVDVAGRSPGRLYGDGLGRFVAALVGEKHLVVAATFGAMAFSTFVFDTLDVATRLGRTILQELAGWQGRAAMVAATAATLAPPALVLLLPDPAAPPAYMKFWLLFGTANQLLAGLALMGVATWLISTGRRPWMVILPMVFVLTITCWSLMAQVIGSTDRLVRLTAVALLGLAAVLAFECVRGLSQRRSAPA